MADVWRAALAAELPATWAVPASELADAAQWIGAFFVAVLALHVVRRPRAQRAAPGHGQR